MLPGGKSAECADCGMSYSFERLKEKLEEAREATKSEKNAAPGKMTSSQKEDVIYDASWEDDDETIYNSEWEYDEDDETAPYFHTCRRCMKKIYIRTPYVLNNYCKECTAEIEKSAGTIVCPRCGGSYPDFYANCPHCTERSLAEGTIQLSTVYCPWCGTESNVIIGSELTKFRCNECNRYFTASATQAPVKAE